MACSPVGVNTCTFVWRDPAENDGRLLGDVRIHQLGALQQSCQDGVSSPILGPDGQPLRGLGLNLYGHAQTAADAVPSAGYTNPLKITAANELYLERDYPVEFYRPYTVQQSPTVRDVLWTQGANQLLLDTTFGLTVTNSSPVDGWYERWLSVLSWSIIDPPPSTIPLIDPITVPVSGVTTSVSVDLNTGTGTGSQTGAPYATITRQNIDDVQSPEAIINYSISVDSGAGAVAAVLIGQVETGGIAGGSQTIRLSDVLLAAGASHTTTLQAYIQPRDGARIPNASRVFSVFPGLIEYNVRLHTADQNNLLPVTPVVAF